MARGAPAVEDELVEEASLAVGHLVVVHCSSNQHGQPRTECVPRNRSRQATPESVLYKEHYNEVLSGHRCNIMKDRIGVRR